MNIGSVSSDDVIEWYQKQLSDAQYRIAILEAQVRKASVLLSEVSVDEQRDGQVALEK